MALRIAFRADASIEIGAGHVMRCLTLANELRLRGGECHFICRAHDGHMAKDISNRGHGVSLLPPVPGGAIDHGDATYGSWLGGSQEDDALQTAAILAGHSWDWLVVDHYAVDWRWEIVVRGHARKIMVIDDLADRRHEADLLLDQNLGREASQYRNLIPEEAKRLIGPAYALLRPEFRELRNYSLCRRESARPQRILVSLGGMDRSNVTGKVLQALAIAGLPQDVFVIVVLGASSPCLDAVAGLASRMPFPCELRVGIDDMARQMADADLAIGAAGGSSWERCALGLPSVMIVLADNQREIATALHRAGAAILVSHDDAGALGGTLLAMLSDRQAMHRISAAASAQCDGLGACRVATEMLAGLCP